jgi:nocturnin
MRILQWNILSSHDIESSFPNVAKWPERLSMILSQVAETKANIVCFQEVDANTYADLVNGLNEIGYKSTLYAQKSSADRPHGNLIACRDVEIWAGRTFQYLDSSQNLAAIRFNYNRQVYHLINTHLKAKPEFEEVRIAQAEQLLKCIDDIHKYYPGDKIIICGDFNTTPDSKTISIILQNGFIDTYPANIYTTYKKRNDVVVKRKIDYIFTDFKEFKTFDLPADGQLLPNESFPSDHRWLLVEI